MNDDKCGERAKTSRYNRFIGNNFKSLVRYVPIFLSSSSPEEMLGNI